MNETKELDQATGEPSREEMMSALFAHMIMQQANLAMMLMGREPHPQTGETIRDLESARLFIDQLEMLETKTKGNLTKQEDHLLKQSLTTLRMAFVESVQNPPPAASPKPAAREPAAPETKAAPEIESADVADEESKKKFTKKY